ncbi:Heat shock protein [Armadillidium nasatum]|uniref:Heat shock protein n=1 Tax=Armadillidium nasatum TaxID=96803 RepID=A0A5N5SUK5_9CRUS|nr:Heat shock protein [Armadillidium nasatum]
MLRKGLRLVPRFQFLLWDKSGKNFRKIHAPLAAVRYCHHQRRHDPFSQMESFIRDMEKKFWGDFSQNFPWFSSSRPRFPRFGFPSESREVGTFSQGIGGPSDLSTSDKFKYAFNFPNAKPDDIKVTLKDRVITVEAKIEDASENSKMNQSFYFQYTLPESIDVEALESVFTHDGVLTIEAPQTSSEGPRTINIKRE